MAASSLSVSSLVVLLLVAVSSGEEDFAFESSPAEEDAQATSARHVRRHWGIPDVMVVAGKLLHVRVPADAFSGAVDHYEAEGSPSKALPSWLLFDKASGLFEGVPGVGDVGENYVIVKAVGAGPHNAAKDVFSVEVLRDSGLAADSVVVVQPPDLASKERCEQGEDLTFLTVLLDARFEHLGPKQRVAAIKNLAGFLSLHHSLFHLEPHSAKEDLLSDQVVLAGPGNVKKRSSKHTTAVRWQVGCEGRLWKQHTDFVHQLRQQAQDGTLAEVVQQPIVGWHVKTEASDTHRERRETGSGDFDDEDDVRMSLFNPDNEEETDTVPEARIVPTMASPVFPEATSHPHRHHHGEDLPEGVELESSLAPTTTQAFNLPVSPILSNPLMHTPTLVPVRPTRLMSMDVIQPSRVYDIDAAPSATPVFVTEVEPSVTPEYGSTQVTDPLPNSNVTGVNDTILSSTGSSSSSSSSTSQSSTPEEEETVTTPPLPRATTERVSPAARPTDETTEYGVKNFPPSINKRLGKFPLTAGKTFRYHIPENTFTDLEEGNTRNLRLIFKTPEGTSVNYKYWAQFNPETQEVYALPLDENVSKWKFIVEALDKEGKSVSDYLELSVQHHKSRRAVNHEFSLHLHVEKNYDYPSVVDWELEVLDALVKLYGDSDSSKITVRSVNVMEPVIFTWTNDTLPKTHCPKDDIDRLYKVLVSDESGKPSAKLRDKLGPKLKVTKVTYQGIGQCSKPPAKPELAAPPPRKPQENFSPTPRNQVDHIRARVGELLVFVVPEDSFYDPEDGSVRNMKLSLMMMDRSPVPPNHWLQFDVKNQEFYGVPLPGEEGREEYQLVCEDKEGLKAHDSLVVEVFPARKLPYSVEFSMSVDTPYSRFRHSAHTKRHFVEKVLELFGDRNVTSVTVSGVQEQQDDGGSSSTVVTWHNQSLAVTSCPRIDALRRVLVADDESISERVNRVLGPDFSVTHIRLVPAGVCLGAFTVIHSRDDAAGAGGGGVDETPVGGAGGDLVGGGDDDYLVTFVVPAVVIVAMLLLAGVVACVLYRRRRRGKMSVGDDDDDARQSFRNRGIPVIFQDELEERPEPDNKSPVIMKDEKPPLPPPEYQQHGEGGGDVTAATPCLAPAAAPVPMPPSAAHPLLQDDAPYQPPPPFTSGRESARQNRPKPTPTYRKPPPYVPP